MSDRSSGTVGLNDDEDHRIESNQMKCRASESSLAPRRYWHRLVPPKYVRGPKYMPNESVISIVFYILTLPFTAAFALTVPDCEHPRVLFGARAHWVTFFMSIVWIMLLCHYMVEGATAFGCTVGIPPLVMGQVRRTVVVVVVVVAAVAVAVVVVVVVVVVVIARRRTKGGGCVARRQASLARLVARRLRSKDTASRRSERGDRRAPATRVTAIEHRTHRALSPRAVLPRDPCEDALRWLMTHVMACDHVMHPSHRSASSQSARRCRTRSRRSARRAAATRTWCVRARRRTVFM